ncbi:MAG TPA: hypothetical protein VF553_09680 [Pyrinomonadaceae bacterium]|jgi:hypothetical protein
MSDDDQLKPIFLPAGVAGPDKRAGYFADAGASIEALDLSDGKPIWRSEVAARPLIVDEKRLAALRALKDQANALQVVVLDCADEGALLVESDLILFPEWVSAAVVTGEAFRYRVALEGNILLLEWEAHARYRGGAPPPRHIQAQATKAESGIAHIDLKRGKVKMLSAAGRSEVELPPALQQASLFSYQMGPSDTWETEPWTVDEKLAAAITGEIAEEQQALQLQRWNPKTGKVEQPVELVKGQALVSYVTPDGAYLFIHSEVGSESSPDAKEPWWLFSVVTGKQMALLGYEQGTREPCVLASHVYYIVENPPPALRSGGETIQSTLKAVDIVSGQQLWQRSLSPQRTRMRPALRQ